MAAESGVWRELVTAASTDATTGWAHCGVAIDELRES